MRAPASAASRPTAESPAPQHLPSPLTPTVSRLEDREPHATPANSVDFESDEPWSPCVQTSRVVGDRFKTPWGATPRDVLKVALGSHRTPLTWQHERSFTYGVEGTSTTLQVDITRPGPPTFVKRDGSLRCESMPCMEMECSSQLLIPVHVKAVTQDGVIVAEGDSQLTVSSRRYIGVSIGQLFATHRGTLRIREIREKGLVADGFGIGLGFSRKGTLVGAIRGSYLVENVGGVFVIYACFPETTPPELRGSDEFDIGCHG